LLRAGSDQAEQCERDDAECAHGIRPFWRVILFANYPQ
jgi:hypothetical protein